MSLQYEQVLGELLGFALGKDAFNNLFFFLFSSNDASLMASLKLIALLFMSILMFGSISPSSKAERAGASVS
jgi:hypothetical protein